jgi:hypothetical protein
MGNTADVSHDDFFSWNSWGMIRRAQRACGEAADTRFPPRKKT